MLGNLFTVSFNYHGALAADAKGQFELLGPATLVGISFGCSSATAATLQVGDAGDVDGIMTAGAVGQSETPNLLEPADFDGALCDQVAGYHFPSDDKVVEFVITHASAEDVALVFYFQEG